MPDAVAFTFEAYRAVHDGYVTLDQLDNVSIDDVDEMLLAADAIAEARARAERSD